MTPVANDETSIRVEAPARLHLGFLDPGASLGRRYGSIGLAIDGLATVVSAAPHGGLRVTGADQDRARAVLERVLAHYDLPRAVAVHLDSAIPAHAGLGSGTQLALALGTAVTLALGRPTAAAELAQVLGRGRRSGIGLSLFDHGGLIVDGGHGAHTITPPVLSRVEFPAEWRVVLVFDKAEAGLSGRAESAAFEALPALPAERAAHLCHLTLMRVLPAVIERDFAQFSAGLAELQAVVGDHFALVQAGRYSSRRVVEVMHYLAGEGGLGGVGQSSWGPTAFAFAPNAARAEAALAAVRARYGGAVELDFMICAARNRGAAIAPAPARARRAAG